MHRRFLYFNWISTTDTPNLAPSDCANAREEGYSDTITTDLASHMYSWSDNRQFALDYHESKYEGSYSYISIPTPTSRFRTSHIPNFPYSENRRLGFIILPHHSSLCYTARGCLPNNESFLRLLEIVISAFTVQL